MAFFSPPHIYWMDTCALYNSYNGPLRHISCYTMHLFSKVYTALNSWSYNQKSFRHKHKKTRTTVQDRLQDNARENYGKLFTESVEKPPHCYIACYSAYCPFIMQNIQMRPTSDSADSSVDGEKAWLWRDPKKKERVSLKLMQAGVYT